MIDSTDDLPLFQGHETEAVVTSTGIFELPILYRDGSMLGLVYRIDSDVASRALSGLPLEPFLIFGKACVLVCMFEYRTTSIGAYNEVGVAIQVKRNGSNPSLTRFFRDMAGAQDTGLYILSLPVTTQEACAGGAEIWGYPKYVTGITIAFGPDEVQLDVQGEFTVKHKKGFGVSAKGFPLITFTSWNERLLRTVVQVGHKVRFGGAHTVQLEITGDGPTSGFIRQLGLDTISPFLAFRTDALRAVLPSGKDVGECALTAPGLR